jgi:hypothetical protein
MKYLCGAKGSEAGLATKIIMISRNAIKINYKKERGNLT